MKTLFAALALVVVSVSSVHAGVSDVCLGPNSPPSCDHQVPEPSSLALLISGIGGLGWWLRKRH